MVDGILEKGYWEGSSSISRGTRFGRFTERFIDIVQPEIFRKPVATGRPTSIRRTAYLDGLRGFAALLVYFGHHQLWAHEEIGADKIFENAYGYEEQYYFASMPFVRTFFSGGHFAVAVFFVISGYVLSAKPLSLIQSGDYLKLGDNLASALFRRWIRLFVPVIVVTFLYLTSFHLFGFVASPEPEKSWADEAYKWYLEFKNFSFIFRTGGDPWFSYSFHTWSIPVEFKGSIIIYTTLAAFSRCTRNARIIGEILLMFYFMYIVDGWYGSMFISGMLLCDLDLLAAANNLPAIFHQLKPYENTLVYILFPTSIYLGGVPAFDATKVVLKKSPGWYWLSFFQPQANYEYKWFYLFWAAFLVNICIPRIPALKQFFESRFCQYLGKISFAFYLVHGPVLWILGDRLYAATGWPRENDATHTPGWVNQFPLSRAGPLGLEISFLAPNLILLPFTMWMGEIATRLIDEPTVRGAQWLYRSTLAHPSNKS